VTSVIQADQLTKRYGSRRGLDGLDLAVEQGEVFGFLGPNGAGKTTTIRLLLDLIRPTSGRVAVFGVEPRNGGPALRRRLGYLAGDFVVDGDQTSLELLTFLGHTRGGVPSQRIHGLADRLELDLRTRIKSLSKGNRQKVGLVQAFMHQPELLILDEPTSGLDPLVQQTFLGLVREAKDQGQTIFMSSHVLSEVQHSADRVGIVRDGRLVAVEGFEDLRARAVRRVEVRFEAPVLRESFSNLPGVDQVRIEGLVLRCLLTGRADDLMKAIAMYPVATILAEEPDLEELFMAFYRAEESSDAA
jgi:ABC-2 type transport system ATP-binding protein